MDEVVVSKDIINKIVMNYLIVEGYKQGALKFEKETGIKGNYYYYYLFPHSIFI